MNSRKIDFTQLGGFGLTQDALEFSQVGNHHGFAAIARAHGHKIIVAGVDDQGATVTDGYVVIDGELMPFVGGAKAPKVWVEAVTDTELFGDSSQKTVYSTRRARMGLVGAHDLADFRRWKTDRTDLDDSEVVASAKAVKKLNDTLLAMLFETSVVLKGCVVSNIDNGSSTLAISPGTVLMAGGLVSSQAYVGTFPVYLKPNGFYDIVQPAGEFIKFDPHTSQRYADVLRRATTTSGEIKTFKTVSDRFDANGVGRWEMLGFKICDDLQSRVPLGLDRRTVDPNDNAWDLEHTVAWNAGGKKRHGLTAAENGPHHHDLETGGDTSLDNAPPGKPLGRQNDDGRVSTIQTKASGSGTPHENRQPFRVVVFAERI